MGGLAEAQEVPEVLAARKVRYDRCNSSANHTAMMPLSTKVAIDYGSQKDGF